MKKLSFLLFTLVFPTLANAQKTVHNTPPDQAAAALIKRVLPEKASSFIVDTSLPQKDGKDVFSVSDAPNGKILLEGNNGVSVASAFNWYLKNISHNHVSWCGDQLKMPTQLPKVGKKVTVTTLHKHRVYFNYCTLSYSAAWWDWKRWQREIDFMAMNGINTPLSVIGLEAVWYNTLLKYGFTDLEARTFLVDPAHMAWQWMTNIETHGGPLPKSWIDSHIKLGQQIVSAQRALGMTPIQQGFSGCVPMAMIKKFPDAKILKGHKWCGFDGTAQLDPLDPLFMKMGKTFLEEEQKLYGTSHLYGCDPFHEGAPPVKGDEYLVKVGKNIQKLLNAHDPKSTWVMQSWSIRKPIATAVPKDRLLVVDLGGVKHKKTKGFWGYDFVSGRLHNFGSRINLHGDIALLAENPFAKIKKEYPKNSSGMGLFMEGIIQNPVYYDLAFDLIWRDESVQPKEWLHSYAHRRYGAKSEKADKAWDLLLETAYRRNTDGVELSSMIAARPALTPKKSGPNRGFAIPYDPVKLLQAWQLLLADADQLKSSDAYRFDVVDIGRQVLSNHSQDLQKRIRSAYFKKDVKEFEKSASRFHQLLKDVDTLLAPRKEYNFGNWVNSARSWGTTPEEKNLYEKNARELVTIWGPTEKPLIFDYSWREWHGLISSYYLKRWDMFHQYIAQLMRDGKEYNEKVRMTHGRESFLANDFYKKLGAWEINWVKTPHPISSELKGDEIELAQAMYRKYAAAIPKEIEITKSQAAIEKGKAEKGKSATNNPTGKKIAKWAPNMLKTSYDVYTFPVNKFLDGAGNYQVEFRYRGGANRLNIVSVELLENGKPIAQDKHQGYAGNEHVKNVYTLPLKEYAFGTKYAVRVKMKPDGGKSSKGEIYLRK